MTMLNLESQIGFALNALAAALCRQSSIDGDKLMRDFAEIIQENSPKERESLVVAKGVIDQMALEMKRLRESANKP
jgi:hypothetical protein